MGTVLNPYLVYGGLALILLSIGLLAHSHYLGVVRIRQVRKELDLLRPGAEYAIGESAFFRDEIANLRSSTIQLEEQLRQRTEALLQQNLVMSQCGTELEQLRAIIRDVQIRMDRFECAKPAVNSDSVLVKSAGQGERGAAQMAKPILQDAHVHWTGAEPAKEGPLSGWRAHLREILKSLEVPQAKPGQ